MKRREFGRAAKVGMVKRATRDGQAHCELCDAALKYRAWDYHHTVEEELVIDKSKPLTADDGLLVCKPCHADITRTQSVPRVAKAKRREAAALGVRKEPRQAIPGRRLGYREREPKPPVGTAALMRRGFVPAGEKR